MKTHFKLEVYSKRKFGRRVGQMGAIISMAGLSIGAMTAQDKPASPVQAASVLVVGKVVTPDGKAVKDAAVFWVERDEEGGVQRRFTVDTDAQGQFRFAEVPPRAGEGRFVILAAQAADWGLSFQNLPTGSDASKPLTITLQPATTLRIAFVDQTGKPLPNLPVRVSALYGERYNYLNIPDSMHGRWEQKTDSKGECVFPGLPQGVRARLKVQKEEFVALSYEDDVTLGKTATQPAGLIRLLPGSIAQGRVTSADGKPVSGIHVSAGQLGAGAGGGGAITDAQGNYRITGLRPGVYNITVQLKGDQGKNATARALEKINVNLGVTLTNQNLTLISGSLVTGKVTDKRTGKPVAGVMIGIYGPARPRSGAGVQSATTGADGTYQARVPAGTQYVYVMGLPSTNYERPKEGVSVTVGEDAPQTQDFVLSPSLAQNLKPVHGHVIGADGKPLPRAKIAVVPVTQDGFFPGSRDIETDASGAFTLQMISSSARLRARSGALATETTTLAQSGEDVTLRLKPNTLLTLGGVVMDDKGKPLPAAKVTLIEWWLDTGMGNLNTTTDAQGHFTFTDLYPDARYSISAEAAGYGNQGTQAVQYKPGEKADAGSLRLPRADSFVAGRVVDENGDPVAKQTVRLEGLTSKYQEAVTDAQGRFRFEGVVNESLNLYLYDDKVFSSPKKVRAGDKDIIIVHKSAGVPQAKADADAQEAARKQQMALLSQPGPRLQAAAWLNTKAAMPESLKGKIVLIDFWAISCGPCVASLPAVQKVSEQFGGRGVVVIGLHASGMEKDTLASFLHAHNVTYPIAIDTDDPQHQTFGQIMRSYGVSGIPTVAVLDREGVVRYLDYGLEGAIKVVGDLLASQK